VNKSANKRFLETRKTLINSEVKHCASVPSRPQTVKSEKEVFMAEDLENPKKYQVS